MQEDGLSVNGDGEECINDVVVDVDDDDDDYANSIPMPVREPPPSSEVELLDDGTSQMNTESTGDINGEKRDDGSELKGDDDASKYLPTPPKAVNGESQTNGTDSNKSSGNNFSLYGGGIDIKDGEGELPPNEVVPIPIEGEYEDVWLDGEVVPKFDMEPADIDATPSAVAAANAETESSPAVENEDFSFTATDSNSSSSEDTPKNKKGPIKRLQNFLKNDNEEKVREETETERRLKWSEWMTKGRKVRGNITDSDSSTELSSEALLDAALDVEKGQDYVVVAVPVDAADGVGPVLPSFPGGKLFQKAIGKTFQDVASFPDAVNGDNNSTYSSNVTSTTVSPTISIDKKIKSPTISIDKKVKKQPPWKKQKQKNNKKQKKEEDAEQKKKRLQQRHYEDERVREPGRISAGDWRHNIINIPSSTILRDVRYPVSAVFAWATLWSVIHKWLTRVVTASSLVESGGGAVLGTGLTTLTLSSRWVNVAAWVGKKMWLPAVQHSMMVSAMSLLLVFRTNSAYQRFAEGRLVVLI